MSDRVVKYMRNVEMKNKYHTDNAFRDMLIKANSNWYKNNRAHKIQMVLRNREINRAYKYLAKLFG
jgi:hypothetical protein